MSQFLSVLFAFLIVSFSIDIFLFSLFSPKVAPENYHHPIAAVAGEKVVPENHHRKIFVVAGDKGKRYVL